MNIQEIKDKVAINYGYKNWKMMMQFLRYEFYDKALTEVAMIYAEEKCKEQRLICESILKSAEYDTNQPIKKMIREAELPKFD